MISYEEIARKAGWVGEVEYNGENDGVRHPITGDWAETWEDACHRIAQDYLANISKVGG